MLSLALQTWLPPPHPNQHETFQWCISILKPWMVPYGCKTPLHWCVWEGGGVRGALCSLHRLHMWLTAPHVLWCCFRMLHSFRSFLVPNPYLYTSCSGNSFVFSSPEYSRVLICSLRTGVPHNSFFFFSHTDILGN